ncbi:hypothetical protein NPIL_2571 [Nephila pilipes]|uniref:PiggyBac transposable element-derived protein domain-containing protein n=1 Tax=Nephila pilipes TaxID=299642 RepID=A0A8X6NI23_NEPPI|nr:hypothetical protein NPIL_2571 [Nephila pilipes]
MTERTRLILLFHQRLQKRVKLCLMQKNVEKDGLEIIIHKIHEKSSGEILDLLSGSDMLYLLVVKTNLYTQLKNLPKFIASEANMRRFVRIYLLTGYHSLPQEEMYWSLDKGIYFPNVRESMLRL